MCKYCQGEKQIEERREDNIYLEIYGKRLRLFGKVYTKVFERKYFINYCPMCGRKLGD